MDQKRFFQNDLQKRSLPLNVDLYEDMHKKLLLIIIIIVFFIILARTPEISQGLGRILSCGARKPEQT